MSDIHKKLEDYLNEDTLDEYLPDSDVEMMDRMIEFIMNLDTDMLDDDQIDEVTDLIDMVSDSNIDEIFDDETDDIDEVVSAKKVKIKPSDKRKRKMDYRRNRAAIKLKAKKFRRTTKFKQWKRRKKIKASSGKTARGKRIRKFL
jgi:hypothetical protein